MSEKQTYTLSVQIVGFCVSGMSERIPETPAHFRMLKIRDIERLEYNLG